MEIGRKLAVDRKIGQRQGAHGFVHVVDRVDQDLLARLEISQRRAFLLAGEIGGGEIGQDPVAHEAPLERAALVGPALVVVGGGEGRDDRLQAWRRSKSRRATGRAPTYDVPYMPTLPSDQGCAAHHSTVS